jgi:hypothetical protein
MLNINVLGSHWPIDTEVLPERPNVVGPGTEYPVGFTLSQIAKLYWTVRSFNINIAAPGVGDAFTTFLFGGGSTGTIVGSLTGLALASMLTAGAYLSGRTKSGAVSHAKIRRTISRIDNGITQANAKLLGSADKSEKNQNNPLSLDADIKQNILGSLNTDVNEGTMAIGGYHKLTNSGGSVFIDFHDIIYARRQYWPKIIILVGPLTGIGPLFSSAIVFKDPRLKGLNVLGAGVWNVVTIGGIIFEGAVIQLFGAAPYFPGLGIIPTPVFGSITTGTKVCDRLYWDGKPDSEREGYKEDECKAVVQDQKPNQFGL